MSTEGRYYSNVTLTSLKGDLSVVVFLPKGVLNNNDDEIFYYSSRFDHGSMIGDITRKRRYVVPDPSCKGDPACPTKVIEREHVLYGTDAWRQPHNTHWPESGVGLASEFGVGDDGSFCYYRCGWYQENDVTNGVLGYQEANIGEPFLKIGVGEIIKGTCPLCDSSEDYKFNSPYLFGSQPVWNFTIINKTKTGTTTTSGAGNKAMDNVTLNTIRLDHEAMLRTKQHGYGLSKLISLNDHVLEVTSTLTNKGVAPFSTVWYSHNFFTCDHTAVGPGYSVDLNLQGSGHTMSAGSPTIPGILVGGVPGAPQPLPPLFDEPGTWSWTTPLLDYARLTPSPNSVHLEMKRALDPGTRIKTEFTKDPNSDGGFTFNACQSSIQSSLRIESDDPDRNIHNDPTIKMYAYNVYIERGTFSPEPQILIRNLQPNQTVSWTQRLVIQDVVTTDDEFISQQGSSNNYVVFPSISSSAGLLSLRASISTSPSYNLSGPTKRVTCWFVVAGMMIWFVVLATKSMFRRYRQHRRGYSPIGEQ
jgi:hypothetical protein